MIRPIFQNLYDHFFYFYFLNMDISAAIYEFDLKLSMNVLKVLLEGSVSQIVDLGLSFYFMTINR